MWAEQVCEGSRQQRVRLDRAPMSLHKLGRRSAKHILWLGISALTALSFVGYFVPIRELSLSLATPDGYGWAHFWLLFFTATTYINAGWLREQICIYMCPYARFQSAMVDADTLVVAYNPQRGEPRGFAKSEQQAFGDCVNCSLCVQVCPTGIDIRDGLQYQCIGCAHCIDACNQVMSKLQRDSGLIGYTTLRSLQGAKSNWLRPRSLGYSAATLIMLLALGAGLVSRPTIGIAVDRERGELYVLEPSGMIRNNYRIKITNKTNQAHQYELSVPNTQSLVLTAPNPIRVPAQEHESILVSLRSSASNTADLTTPVVNFELCTSNVPNAAHNKDCITEESRFFFPVSNNPISGDGI